MPDYFTLDELREYPDVGSSQKFSDERCEAVAAALVSVIEREVGTSFVGRTVTDELYDGGRNAILLRAPYVLEVSAVSEDGVDIVSDVRLRNGVIYRDTNGSLFTSGFDNVSVTYLAGYSATPPADVKEMALKGTRAYLLSTAADAAINDRRTSLNTDMGVIQFVVAGEDRPTGYPEVDAMILGWKRRLNVPKVA